MHVLPLPVPRISDFHSSILGLLEVHLTLVLGIVGTVSRIQCIVMIDQLSSPDKRTDP